MKMHLKIIYAIINLSLLIISCSPQKEPDIQGLSVIGWGDLQLTPKPNDHLCPEIAYDELEWEHSKRDFSYGLFGAIYPEHISGAGNQADRTAWINANEQQLLNWRLWYPEGNERSATLRLFVLLDERQLNNALPQPGVYNDINLERGDDISLKVTIPPLDAGVHDIIAIGVPYPEEDPNEYGIVKLVYWRITLVAGPTSSIFRKIDFVSLSREGSIRKKDPQLSLELTLKNDGIDIWNWPDRWLSINTDTSTTFFALAGHKEVTNLDAPPMDELQTSFFSLLLFADYRQVEVAPNQMALYGKVDKDTAYTRVALELPALSEGKHQILVLRIDTPGVPMCILRGEANGRILPNSVDGKLVGIHAIPPK